TRGSAMAKMKARPKTARGKRGAASLDSWLKGRRFALSGRLPWKGRILDWIERDGGQLLDAVKPELDYLIVESKTKPTAPQKKAAQLNQQGARIEIIDENDFWRLMSPSRAQALAMLTGGKNGHERWRALPPRHLVRDHLVLPDLSKADLRGCNLQGFDFQELCLDHADLRGANLRDSCNLQVTGAQLGAACLAGANLADLIACSLAYADLRGARVVMGGKLDGSDFTAAKLDGFSARGSATGTVFRAARLVGASFYNGKFSAAQFARANLTGAELNDCNFDNADFSGTNLSGVQATRASFRQAELGKAILRQANLGGAAFTDARLAGADFTGAKVFAASFEGVDTSTARGLAECLQDVARPAGPCVLELDAVARHCESLQLEINLQRARQPLVRLEIRSSSRSVNARCADDAGLSPRCQSKTVADAFREFAHLFRPGKPLLETAEIQASKSPFKKEELRAKVLAAWCEAFGQQVPSAADRASSQDEARESFLSLLRQGNEGVRKWNDRAGELAQAGHFRAADLAGLDLTCLDLNGLDFSGANFANADLSKARCTHGRPAIFNGACFRAARLDQASLYNKIDATDADFQGASLAGASLGRALLVRANFQNADLTGANLDITDLRGANLTAATLVQTSFTQARFDEHTRFPKGFRIPLDMKWVGSGKRPNIPRKPKKAIDFDTFMDRLRKALDVGKISNALSMLKAQRFQLFSELKEDSVVGVVRSQSSRERVYACRLGSDGTFSCGTQNLRPCGGLGGALCKHLLVLIIGLARAGQLEPTHADLWVSASLSCQPSFDKDAMSETFLRYKGAEAGEVDWRPTETIPEDYYAL
ncbi:MAG: pentapeptide repeat-containing protein, partial [Gemmataceae bacterium]